MKAIINNEKSFNRMLLFIKKHFENVRVVNNKNSHLAKLSQDFFKIILFENRGAQFSIKWNCSYSTLFFGDITKNKKTSLQYTFTKMKLDYYYPVEELNNHNVVFWMHEKTDPHDDASREISPLRLPVTVPPLYSAINIVS